MAGTKFKVVLPERNGGWGFVRGHGIRHDFGLHAHASLTLGRILSGRRRIECDGEAWDLGPDDAFAIAPWKPHACFCDDPEGHDYLVVSVSPQLLGEISGEDGAFVCPRSGPLEAMPQLQRLFESAEKRDDGAFRRELGQFLENCRVDGSAVGNAGLPPLCEDACRYLLALLDENVSLEELAGHAGVSPYYFHRLFRAGTGMPPHAWQLQARVRASLDRLLSEIPIQQVALDLGFSDQSHFNRVFRRAMGVSPGRLEA